ncbi:MAG: lipoate--protein ligase family protein [Nitrospirota bacterium]|nr:lipoate--protein ligase family protein [Nitrospirota bacterium]
MNSVHLWRYIDSGPGRASDNMAVDEQLLAQALLPGALPVLRFYAWDPPAVSIGRFQRLETAVNADACRRRGVDVVRRITGGRAVLHNSELTYSIVCPEGNALFPPDVIGTYKVIAAGLLAGLRNLGIPAELVTRTGRHAELVKKNSRDPSCFSSPSWYEIVVSGRKIVGSAQRRVPGAFLQHGSILISHDPLFDAEVIPCGELLEKVTSIERELRQQVPLHEVKAAFCAGFSSALGITLLDDQQRSS